MLWDDTSANESLLQHAWYQCLGYKQIWVSIFASGQHAGSPYMRGTLCWIAHSPAELRNVPSVHLTTGHAHVVLIYPSGMPRNGLYYYPLINIMAHYRHSNNKEKMMY